MAYPQVIEYSWETEKCGLIIMSGGLIILGWRN
jgi:hypothetical protein